uniref:Uncharacterized protein n=1 Tax=Noccaea caerulescens TaxID=107243 RepID=A0A1J3DYK4_NOCCA
MVAPSVAAVSSDLPPPCPAVIEHPMEDAPVSESTLSQLGFPNEFPYEFDSSALTSPDDSTETEDETSDDEDDFLAGLTRRLALSTQRLSSPPSLVTDKAQVKPSNSPESTLSGLVSPNGPFSQVPSPPTTPSPEDESLKVISAAAGEVAKMKKLAAKPNCPPNTNPNSFIPFPHQNAAFCSYYCWLWPYQSPMIALQPALNASPIPVFAAPPAVKQPSTGTGVFLPRKYPNPSDDSRKNSGGGCVKFPKKVVHQQNPKTEELSGRCQPHSQAGLSKGRSKSKIECLKTKPSRRPVSGGCVKEERHLPQEWVY